MPDRAAQVYPKALAGADWLVRADTQAVLAALRAAGHQARVVGGAVRNALLAKPVGDVDIATTALPAEILAAGRAAGLHTVPTGIEHGTVTIISGHEAHEVTTLRRDVETDGRRATVAFTDDWLLDAGRRDLTMNALYCDADGTVHDPVGGYGDLQAGRVRFIGDPDQRIAEDYLRILRFFRFYAEHGRGGPDRAGLDACLRGRHGLERLSAERIRAEMLKLLAAPRAVDAVDAMTGHGLLSPLLGRAPRLRVFARIVTAEHALDVAPDAILRLSALALAVTDDIAFAAGHWRLSNAERDGLLVIDGRLFEQIRRAVDDPRQARRLLYEWGPGRWRRACFAAWRDAVQGADIRWLLGLPERWSRPVLPARGRDVVAAGIPAGRAVGELLARLETWWIDQDFPSEDVTRARLAALVAEARCGTVVADSGRKPL